jgi:hypothetical protein
MNERIVFNEELDEILKECKSETTGLSISLRKYNGGALKLQIGPRYRLGRDERSD